MKSFIASILAAAALAIKVKDTTGDQKPADLPEEIPQDLEDWEYEAIGLYYCIDSHGEEDGMVSLLELAIGLDEGVKAGVIPKEFVESFGENVDFTDLLKDHLTAEEAAACDADEDQTLMAGEFGECVSKELERLVEAEDDEGLQAIGQRLHGVEIPLELAGEGLAIAMEGTGAAKEDWADLIGGVADECRAALHGGEGSGSDSDSEDWHDAGMSLGACLDASGNGNGELQVAEIEGLVDALAAEGIISQETHAAIKEQKPEDGDMVVSHEDAAGVVEAMLVAEEVPRDQWAMVVQATADECWDRFDAAMAAQQPPPPAKQEGSGASGEKVSTALAQLRATYGR